MDDAQNSWREKMGQVTGWGVGEKGVRRGRSI